MEMRGPGGSIGGRIVGSPFRTEGPAVAFLPWKQPGKRGERVVCQIQNRKRTRGPWSLQFEASGGWKQVVGQRPLQYFEGGCVWPLGAPS